MKTFEYFVEYDEFVPSGLGDGSGWFESGADWVSVEANTWREARTIGRQKVQEEYPKGAVYANRRDGLHPFHGEHCRVFSAAPSDEGDGE